jgi:uncharacterized membrane protein YhhN
VDAGTVVVCSAVAAAAGAAANWWSRAVDGPRADRVEAISKPTVTVAIGVLAAALAAGPGSDVPAGAAVAAVIGFVLCLVGDVALLPAVDRFVVGLGSFLAGHVAFVVMFVVLGLEAPWLGLVAVGLAVAIAVGVGRPVVRGARAVDPGLVGPVCAYLAVISTMTVVGWATGRPAAIVGSSLFVLSDSILAWRRFVRVWRWAPLAIMVTYHGALVGLALSLAG